jgi:hypothetical protein
MSYLEFETRAAEKAELQDLLLRLQDAHVDAQDVDVGAWYDPVRRKWNDLYGYFRVSSKDIAKTCEKLLEVGSPTFVGKHEDCETELKAFIKILQTETDSETKSENVQLTASKWKHLKSLLESYENDRTISANAKTITMAKINTLKKQMNVYATYWAGPFKNSK